MKKWKQLKATVAQYTSFHSDHTLRSFDKPVFVFLRFQINASVVLVFVFDTVTTYKVSFPPVSTMHVSFFCDFFLFLSPVVRY